jgi:hypothetical protein
VLFLTNVIQFSTKIIDQIPIIYKYQDCLFSQTIFLFFDATKIDVTTHDMPSALLILHRKLLATTPKSEYKRQKLSSLIDWKQKDFIEKDRHLDVACEITWATSAKHMPSCFLCTC